jgi:acetyl esterase
MLDPQLQNLLDGAQAAGAPDFADLPPAACRGFYREILRATDIAPVDVAVSEQRIAGPGGGIGLRIYVPHGKSAQTRGLVVYYHGGGFLMGDLAGYDSLCRTLALQSDCVLVSVDYRLAPEHPFPAAVDDSLAALRWAHENAESFGADPQRIAVAGDSAGGTLAAVTALQARDQGGPAVRYQALVYPMTAATPGEYPSYEKYGEGHVLSRRAADYFMQHYIGSGAVARDFRIAPMLADDLSGLPPALVMLGGHDILHDEGLAYAERLFAAGVQVTLVDYLALGHGFISMAGAVDAGRLAIDQLAGALGRALRKP